MDNYTWIIVAVAIVLVFTVVGSKVKVPQNVKAKAGQVKKYTTKPFLSVSEKKFLDSMSPLAKYGLIIVPQVNLASIIKKIENARYNTELFRNIDFGIFDKNYNVKLLVELNDASHNQKQRQYRDVKVRQIAEDAGVPVVTFYTNKPNAQDYVLHRIVKVLKDNEAGAAETGERVR